MNKGASLYGRHASGGREHNGPGPSGERGNQKRAVHFLGGPLGKHFVSI